LASTYYVSKSGDNGNGGTSWEDSWLTIQYAVDNISSGDTIEVGPGVYSEQVSPPNFDEETIITGYPDMDINTIFDGINSVEVISIVCNGSGNFTTWKNMSIAYLIRTTASVHDINFQNILLKEGSSGQVTDVSCNNIVFKNCVAYKLTSTYAGFRSGPGIEVYDCIALECHIGIVTDGVNHHNCAYGCTTNFSGIPGIGSIELDPVFEDVLNNDFRLKSSSPCIGAGTSNIGIYQGSGTVIIYTYSGDSIITPEIIGDYFMIHKREKITPVIFGVLGVKIEETIE